MSKSLQDELAKWIRHKKGAGQSLPGHVVSVPTPKDSPPKKASAEYQDNVQNIICEDDRFWVMMNPPGQEHGPAHVHVRMKGTSGWQSKGARLALVQTGAGEGYAVTMPYYFPGEDGAATLVRNRMKFNMTDGDLQAAIDCVNGHIGLCIANWKELHRGTPDAQNFVTENEVDGFRFGRIISHADMHLREPLKQQKSRQ